MSSSVIRVQRYHDICCGHRVVGHEGKCVHLHGHNYRVHFIVESQELDAIGRVLDFSVIKTRLCQWLEDNWDHKFLVWTLDEEMRAIHEASLSAKDPRLNYAATILTGSLVWVPFNPTAENLANYLLKVIGPSQLHGTGALLTEVKIEETAKCSATATYRTTSSTY